MALRLTRVVTALVLVAGGALMHAASWQRWAGFCPWGSSEETASCNTRMDHLYDFLFVADPWEPIGNASELAGISLLLVALAFLLLPWALLGRPGLLVTAALGVSALAVADAGLAVLRSGLAGEVVDPVGPGGGWTLFLVVPTSVVIWAAVLARGWARAGAIFVVLGSPPVALFTYAIGPFDAAPWWEAYAGDLTALGGLCLLVAAARRPAPDRAPATEPATEPATGDVAEPATGDVAVA